MPSQRQVQMNQVATRILAALGLAWMLTTHAGTSETSTSIPPAASPIGELWRSTAMRAERAKLKSRRDDPKVAEGKRSAALGYGLKMISSFFPSGLAPLRRAKPEGKKEVGEIREVGTERGQCRHNPVFGSGL